MASGPITSWQIDGETMETVTDFIFLGSKITADGDCSQEIKRHLLLGRKAMTNLDSILKSRDITLPTKVSTVKAMAFAVVMYGCEFSSVTQSCPTLCNPMNCSTPSLPVHHQLPDSIQTHVHWVGDAIQPSDPLLSPSPPALNLSQYQGLFQIYGFSSGHVWMWELDYKESWVLKNWCFWTVVLEKILESPLDCKEIKPVNPKGDQSWIFIGRTDVDVETPILWPLDVKSWLIRKFLRVGKIEGRRKRGWQRTRWLDGTTNSMDKSLSKPWEWWWAGKPGVLYSMESQRVGHDWATEQHNNT